MSEMRKVLRALPVLTGSTNMNFDPEKSPQDPIVLFKQWLDDAIQANLSEPHVMTISTIDIQGYPDSRVLILKDIDAAGWYFAISKKSPKGVAIANNNRVALSFYWQAFARQVRVRGVASELSQALNERDFLSRSPEARAMALVAKQSDVLQPYEDIDELRQAQLLKVNSDPNLVSENWRVYCVSPENVEFWQGDSTRKHIRLRYERSEKGFEKSRLWP
jgi:pyridoxamine 5'-phosphate oxidase